MLEKFIAITGCDGCGKSTLATSLKKYFEEKNESITVVSIWDSLFADKNSLGLNPNQIDDYLSSLSSFARAHFLMHALTQALAMAQKQKTTWLLYDSYWYKYLAAEFVRTKDLAIKHLSSHLPKPNVVFWIEIPVNLCAERKSRFSGFETDFKEKNKEAFISFQSEVQIIHRDWAIKDQAILLDGLKTPKDLLKQCLNHL